jgi:hypothetical protein
MFKQNQKLDLINGFLIISLYFINVKLKPIFILKNLLNCLKNMKLT